MTRYMTWEIKRVLSKQMQLEKYNYTINGIESDNLQAKKESQPTTLRFQVILIKRHLF